MTVDVLGITYNIKESNKVDDMILLNSDGYCDSSNKTIVIDTFQETPESLADLKEYRKQVLRHELVHAFLHESGLASNSWGKEEEIVDWIALQFPKMAEAFKKAKAI